MSVLRRGRAPWSWLAMLLAGASALVSLLIAPLSAQASPARQVVRYQGYRLSVPAGWPVYDLATHPHACVRFNRHAVYLGRPGTEQRCPSHVMGRTGAILIQPISGEGSITRPASATLPAPSLAGAEGRHGNEAQVVDRAHGVVITATWKRHPKVIDQVLGVRSLEPATARVPAPARALADHTLLARTASAASAGQVYTGQGFDACTAPSSSQMSAWSSAYRAIGVYIGGANMGCSQANLTSSWVSQQSAAGWHLIPIYVGLQAPGNSCGCAAISSGSAAAQGKAAAQDAVSQAQSIGLGQGNPIYYDMEGYARGGTTSSSVLTFLSAWTQQLHAERYKSGVYSSDASGIVDLASRNGNGYSEPDDLWAAAWNGQANTSDGSLPSGAWANHQRVHQYAGNENQTHGGVTINIDSDYVDAATAAAGSSTGGGQHQPSPSYWVYTGWGNVYGSRGSVFYGSPWASHAGNGQITGMAPTTDGKGYRLVDSLGHVYPYGDAQSLAQYVSANHPAISGIVASPSGGYWLYTASGAVYTSAHATWYGSPWASHSGDFHITGMASTPDGRGYWLVDSSGHVYHYGDAQSLTQYLSPNHPWISGIVASPTGGYWLYTASGTVYTSAHATWYGSPWASHSGDYHFTGMAPTPDGKGYWMVDSSGHVYHYGDAPGLATGISSSSPPINGIVR